MNEKFFFNKFMRSMQSTVNCAVDCMVARKRREDKENAKKEEEIKISNEHDKTRGDTKP